MVDLSITPATIEVEAAELRALDQRDKEAAAAGAEMLRTETLAAIAEGAPNPAELARAALTTVDEDLGGD